MRTHHNARRVVNETPLCIRTRDMRMHQSRRGRAPGVYKKDPSPIHFSLFTFHSSLLISSLQMVPKGKATIPTRFSLWLAALRARQSTDKAGPSNTALMNPDPIIISSDSESEEIPEYIPGAEPTEDEEEAPEYVLGDGMMENQDHAEEDPEMDPKEEPEEDPEEESEEDPKEDPKEEPEEDPEEDPSQDPEDEEMEEVVNLQPGDDEYDEYFAD
ncbi:hypothetical protein PIB30_073436 [Stylosanthes scabra]|uniref:Uncharacterized protein n=1 Tax=Stylosanthes scabra TaxID=79078 RepID=A0ABU6UT21_9FABA|nr:hypothetical protein [Stylosanthes scabra]